VRVRCCGLVRFGTCRSEDVGDLRTDAARVDVNSFELYSASVASLRVSCFRGPGAVDGRWGSRDCAEEGGVEELSGCRLLWRGEGVEKEALRDNGGERRLLLVVEVGAR
jgi:hypothetical protein